MKGIPREARTSRIGKAIVDARSSGRLGLILCVIPGFPDQATYEEIRTYLEACREVTSVEVTYPASTSFSETVNDTLVRANLCAVQVSKKANLTSLLRINKHGFVQFYRETVEAIGFERLLRENSLLFDGVILEWREEDILPYVNAAREAGMELIQCIPVGASEDKIEILVQFTDPGGLVYVSCAPRAGGTKPPAAEISACIRSVKMRRPDAVVMTALGIRTPDDVRAMARMAEVDAVVIGTAFINAEDQGLAGVQKFLDEIRPALAIT